MKDKLIKLLRRAEKDKPYPDELTEQIMYLIAPSLDAAEEVSKFIRACSLNPFHGYATCARCFFRLTCAKKKIEVKDAG